MGRVWQTLRSRLLAPRATGRLLIAGMIDDYPEDLDAYDEVWGVNRIYDRAPGQAGRLSRLYYFDHHSLIDDAFVERVNACGCRVVTKWPDRRIPRSEAFPLDALVRYFGGTCYFTCTVAYMLAHAIFERRWQRITLAGMYHATDSWEYVHHKPCVEFWVGVAYGAGTDITVHGDSMLCRPHDWESEIYGYETNDLRRLQIDTIAAAYTACRMYPVKMLQARPPAGTEGPAYVSRFSRLLAQIPRQEETPV